MDVSASASASGDVSGDGQPATKKRRLSFKGLRNSFRRSGRGRRSNKGVKGLKYKQGSPRVEADVSGDVGGDVELKPKGGEYCVDPPPFWCNGFRLKLVDSSYLLRQTYQLS